MGTVNPKRETASWKKTDVRVLRDIPRPRERLSDYFGNARVSTNRGAPKAMSRIENCLASRDKLHRERDRAARAQFLLFAAGINRNRRRRRDHVRMITGRIVQ